MLDLLVPFLAGLLVGVNPYAAPGLRARLPDVPPQDATAPRLRVAGAGIAVAAAVAVAIGAIAWWAAAFVSTLLTYGLLVVGIAALLGALHAWSPISGRPAERGSAAEEPETVPAFAWVRLVAGDVAYYAAPAWALALAFAMRSVTLTDFVRPLAAAWAGVALALAAWSTIAPDRLPAAPPAKGRTPTRAGRGLAAAYAAAAALLLLAFAGVW